MARVDHSVVRLLTKVYRGLGSPVARRAARLVELGEWRQLQELPAIDPQSYADYQSFKRDYQAREFFRKVELPGDDRRRSETALETFMSSERQNALTNARLAKYIHNGPYDPQDMLVHDFICRWRQNCERVLGRLPERLTPLFTPGSTLTDLGPQITIPDKMSSQLSLYPNMVDIWNHSVCGIGPLDRAHNALIVKSNRYFTVPKDSSTYRSCCVEASGAVMLQRSVGVAIRERYDRAYSVRLAHAQSNHWEWARKGSLDGSVATIDLKSASDTICRNLVTLVIPESWLSLLLDLRASSTEVKGKILFNEKFSSMGNGFTFELETLLFRTLLETLGCSIAYTFGDDLIVDTEHVPDVLAALAFFGFTPNPKKTFCEGPFRESCGGDYFRGEWVTPARMKKLPDEPQHWIVIANMLRAADPGLTWAAAAWHYCIGQLPSNWRLFGPDWVGDGLIHDPGARPVWRKTKSYNGPGYFYHRPLPRTVRLERHFKPEVVLKSAVLGVDHDVSLRGKIDGYKLSFVPAYGLGGEPFEALRTAFLGKLN